MSYQENIHQFQVMKSLFEVEEKLAERRSELEIKCRNARYLHLKRPNDPSFDLPYECIHLNSVPKFRGIYSKVEKKELDGEDSSRIGEHVRQYESGKAGSGAVSSGKGDPGGVSYGTYQLSSKTGDAKKFISWSAKHNGAGKEFKGLKPGTSAFNQKWKEVNKRNPASWGKEQYDFIYQTHYKPQVEFLKKRGIDVNKLGKAEKEAVWSAAIQYGSHTNIIAKAFEGRDIYSMSSEQRVNSIYDYKWKTRKSYFRRAYSNGSGSGIENRIRKERMTVLGILQGK